MSRKLTVEELEKLERWLPETLQTCIATVFAQSARDTRVIQLPPDLYHGLYSELARRKVFTEPGRFRGRVTQLNPHTRQIILLDDQGLVQGIFDIHDYLPEEE